MSLGAKREGRVSANRTNQTDLFCCVQKRERERKNGFPEPPTDV
jgi:hypothetical protein